MKLGVVDHRVGGGGEALEHSVSDTVLSEVTPTARAHVNNNGLHKISVLCEGITVL